ncbi:DUF4380 domain-containing protein [Actinotalea sp. M2MS4P-6]|uniref:DUF4380 domain-containing protein n=1 Tax=Actinotalea sp. M2MS4P-6 TaxID=2983762 RepID=UPI0021E4E670|nr:DUF4380 domain-containing protein [Actinotalea sp. M2MS4P-6]MCV2395894.1 DUF4380 domain-containing protein [Actinotalea sp. M2MS4P-6]
MTTHGEEPLPVLRIGNGSVDLAFLPSVGGRLISVRVDGVELLWRNSEYLDGDLGTVRARSSWAPLDGTMGSWANLGGSKTWPAPQGWSGPGEWPGPPDPVIDSGSWDVDVAHDGEDAVVTFTSPDDPRTGLRVVREFRLPATGTTFRHRVTFRAIADRPVTWAIWEVCQVDTEMFAGAPSGNPSGVWVGVRGGAEPRALVADDGLITVDPPAGGRRRVHVDDVVAKVGFTDADGTLEVRRPDGAGVAWSYSVLPGAAYPDGGCAAEIWMQYPTAAPVGGGLRPTARLLELEALGPLTTLEPGAETSLEIVWHASSRMS